MVLALIPKSTQATTNNYITFSSSTAFTLKTYNETKNWDGTLYYSTDLTTWNVWDGTTTLNSSADFKLYLRGTGNTNISSANLVNDEPTDTERWVLTGDNGIACTGNIETLLDYETVAAGNHPTMAEGCYYYMFKDCTLLSSAPDLPATTLTDNCYSEMFEGCTSLSTAPSLPAMILTEGCYGGMFQGCTSLSTAPDLPATTLANSCYCFMFKNCTLLSSAPDLPATTLADSCYGGMFSGCTSLTSAPNLPATTLKKDCYGFMFSGCTSLISAPSLPATTLADTCYGFMFYGCTSLISAPALPATTLADSCYVAMFNGCISLSAAPALPATTLADSCYCSMFYGCTSLVSAPTLPATILADSCYSSIFEGCTSLKVSATQVGEYSIAWRIPTSGTANTQDDWNTDMLKNTGGTFTGNPTINTTYYLIANKYSVTHTLTNLSATTGTVGENKATRGSEYTTTLSADNGFTLPSTITVTIGSLTATADTDYTYDTATGVLTVLASKVTGDIVISAASKATDDTYITFSSTTAFTLKTYNESKNWDGTLYYSTDLITWNEWDATAISSSADFKLYLRGINNSVITGDNVDHYWVLTGNNGIACTGNIENLLDYNTVRAGSHPTMANFCYGGMFKDCTHLSTAPSLPATTLSTSCYGEMFAGCTSLSSAPNLPATTLAEGCYCAMFGGCTSLSTAPDLPATTLADGCYSAMFKNCALLTTAPALPATALTDNCYQDMFKGCASLTSAPELPATTLRQYCYNTMFDGCTSLSTPPALPATTLADGCYKEMFNGCIALKVSATRTNGYYIEWRIPSSGTANTANDWDTDMLKNTGGAFTGNPTINTTYYLFGGLAPTISITTQPEAATTVTAGSITGSLSVVATTKNASGAVVTYQWYKNTTNSASGGTAISGATSASFDIPTSLTKGTYYYYCVLNATGCSEVTTSVAGVTVNNPTGTISGTVTKAGSSVSGATVKLMKGALQIGSPVTSSTNGTYSFDQVEYGVYSVEVTTAEGKTVTIPVTLLGSTAAGQDVVIPNVAGNQNTKVVVQSTQGTPDTSADLNSLFDSSPASDNTKGITQADKDVIAAGGTVEIKLTADIKNASNISSDADKIKELSGDSNADYLFVDLSVIKTVTPNGGASSATQLTEVNDFVDVAMEVPSQYRADSMRIFRIHEGVAEELGRGITNANIYGEYYTLNLNYSIATLHIKRFSTYAMSVNVVSPITPLAPTPHTGDENSIMLWISLLILSGGILTYLVINKRRNNQN